MLEVFCSRRDGNLQDIVNRGSLHEFLVGLHEEFGPVASFWFGSRPVVSLGSVQQLRQHINPNHSSTHTSSYPAASPSHIGVKNTVLDGFEAVFFAPLS